MYCPSYCTPYSSTANISCFPQLYAPCVPCGDSNCSVSKLADFAHYGGRYGRNKNNCCPPPQNKAANQPPPVRKYPPLPPCQPTCITTQNCKDLPAQRLRNVDVLEELCYYVPGGDPNGPMDCYTVDCCGNVEKISDPCCCNQESSPPQPVKYSRRQRFTFNDPGGSGRSAYDDPWPFADNCGGSNGGCGNRSNRRSIGGGSGDNKSAYMQNSCCASRGRKYTYCPEEDIDCSEMLPPESGVYYFDRDRRAFVPERDLPKAPEVIEKQVKVPDVEEYEIFEEDTGETSSGGGKNLQTIQPVVQPIIMPSNAPCPPPACNPCPPPCPPPCNPYPPPCNPCPPPCNPYPPPCNPCYPPCNPCPPQCNPCPPQCNPCAPQCNPCCNPCAPQCNPCCSPCGPMNPLMNCCGGVLPMVIPMCPQQPAAAGFGGGMMPPPPPFPFPPPFMQKEKKKKKSSKKHGSISKSFKSYGYSGSGYPDTLPAYGDDGEPTEVDSQAVDNAGGEEDYDAKEQQPYGVRRSLKVYGGGQGQANAADGGYGKNTQMMDDGTIVTTIDFPPGEAENVTVAATDRRNPREPNIDVVAEVQGGQAKPGPPGQPLAPDAQYTENGANVTTYTMPEGKDGYVKASRNS